MREHHQHYAANNEGVRFYPFILRTDQNYEDYNWVETLLDGSDVDVIYEGGGTGQEAVDTEYQEGMVQCFKRGGDSTNIVNYGEYVIIDTVSKDNPENGKVFRRGMNFDNDLGGAEYIGQIVGPKGSTADLEMTTYKEISDNPPYEDGHYTPTEDNQGLVPGANDAEDEFHDAIDYAWTTLRDAYGNIKYYQIGFRFPYLVQHFIARVRNAYKPDGTPLDDIDELITRIDNKEHPFFSKWRIDVPKGIKGESVTDIQTLPTKIKAGSTIYSRVDAEGHLSGAQIVITSAPAIDLQTIVSTKDKGYVELKHDDETWYADLDDCFDLYFVRENINYDEHENGDIEYESINSYRVLKDVSINTGVKGYDGNQKVHIVYEGANEDQAIEEDIGKPLNYIYESAVVNKSDYIDHPEIQEQAQDPYGVPWGSLLAYYSDPATRALYTTYRHYSVKQDAVIDGWVILGNVLKPGSIQSICNFTTYDEIGNRTPEQIGGSNAYKGWVVTVGGANADNTYYAYDYDEHKWYFIGTISTNGINPKTIIDINDTSFLLNNGISLKSKVRKSIY